MIRYHVQHFKNGEWLDVINMETGKVVYRYREHSSAKLFKEITERYSGEYRLIQEDVRSDE